jgi:hypothetical protein
MTSLVGLSPPGSGDRGLSLALTRRVAGLYA